MPQNFQRPEEPDWRVSLDPDEPGIDRRTRERRLALIEINKMTSEELFAVAVEAGIYTPDGQLTEHYRDDGEPSAHRPYALRCPHCNGVVS